MTASESKSVPQCGGDAGTVVRTGLRPSCALSRSPQRNVTESRQGQEQCNVGPGMGEALFREIEQMETDSGTDVADCEGCGQGVDQKTFKNCRSDRKCWPKCKRGARFARQRD